MTAATATGGRRRVSGLEKAGRREAALLVMPSLIPILVLSVAPLIMGIALAFTDARLVRRPKVGSAWGAVSGLLPVRFPRPPAEPDVRLSPHPALHERGLVQLVVTAGRSQGVGMW